MHGLDRRFTRSETRPGSMDRGRFRLPLIVVSATLAVAVKVDAAIIALYDFGTTTSPSYASADANPNSAASGFAPSTGLGSTGNWNSTNNGINTGAGAPAPEFAQKPISTSTQALAFNNNTYWSFTLTPNANYKINLTDLTLQLTVANSGLPVSYYLGTSIGGFANPVGTPVTNATGGYATVRAPFDLTGSSYQNLTTPIEFRLYVWNTTGTSGSSGSRWGFDNITVNGSIVPLPEPASLVLVAAGFLMIGYRRHMV